MQSFHLATQMEAPHFTLPDADMESFSLISQLGKHNLVLYFHPRNCLRAAIQEASEFSDLDEEFDQLETRVIGISPYDCWNLAEMRDEHGLSVVLLSDAETCVCKRYGVIASQLSNGHKKEVIHRSTFIINKQGILTHVMYNIQAHGHPMEVLTLIKGSK